MSGEEPATQIAPVESPKMVSIIKLPILKKGEYTFWSMRMEQYLTNTDYNLWQVILNGDGPIQVTTDENGVETKVPPKTAQALLQRQRERKAKSILLLAIPDEYQLRFHGIKDAKTLWAAIKSRFGGLDKAYDRKAGIDDLDIDDLYNNLKVFEVDIKGSSGSSSNSQNVAFLSAEYTSSSNEINTANGVSTASGHNSQGQASSSSYTDDLIRGHFARECRATRNQGNRNGDERYRSRDNTRMTVLVETSDALVIQDNALIVQDGLGYDWSYIAQEEPTEFDLMAYTSNSSGSDTEVQSCSKHYVKTYEKLQKQFDEQRQTLSKANLEMVAYQLGLESVEAQLVVHQTNKVVYEEKIAVLEFNVKDKSNAITRLKNQLDETLREKDDLKAKLEYRSSDRDDNQINDRFKKDSGYNVVPPPLTGNYMPPLDDLSFARFDNSVYRLTMNKTSSSVSQVETSITPPSNTSVEMPRVESVRPSGVIIEDWVSDDDEDIFQSNDLQATDKPSFKRIEFTNARNESVKPKQAEKPRITTQNPKRMAKKSVLKKMGKNTDQREIRPVWNNVQRINHQNKFVPSAVLTRSRKVQVSTAKKSSLRATRSTSTFRPVNTATHTNRVNVSKLRINAFHKSHSPIRRSFYKPKAPNTRILNEKVNTVKVNGVNTAGQIAVSGVKENGVTVVKASAGYVWRPKMTDLNNVSKDKSGSWVSKRVNYIDPQGRLKEQRLPYLILKHYSKLVLGLEETLTLLLLDGGFVAFGGSARGGKITGK
ncbi:hypothetical protein Tco_1517597 [Tanacetum coccineum]